MNPNLQLILGCFGLSATISYAYWCSVRVTFLQMDLEKIGDMFTATLKDRGMELDQDGRRFLDSLEELIEDAPLLSPAVIGPISRVPGVDLAGFLGPGAEPFFELFLDPSPRPPELNMAIWKVSMRLARYLALETLTGWISIAKWLLLGNRKSDLGSPPTVPATPVSLNVVAFAKLLSRGQYRQTA